MRVVFNQIDKVLAYLFSDVYIATALTVCLIMYAGLAAPTLPPFISSLFESPLVKLLILFLILLMSKYNLTISLLATIAFALSLQTLNRYHMFSMATELANEGEAEDATMKAEMDIDTVEMDVDNVEIVTSTTDDGMSIKMPEASVDVSEYNSVNNLQPQSFDPVLPPQPEIPEQVAAVNGTCNYQGPQGMQSPSGFAGKEVGADF